MDRQDVFKFFKDSVGRWRWRRTAPNGVIVGASSQGYKWKISAKRNARREGYGK